jgi:nitroreductase
MSHPNRSIVEQILDLARWAPSGDNTQPWRFEILGPQQVVVHGFDTRAHCVYDLDGHASQISLGALLETAAIAATLHGWRMHASRRVDAPADRPTFDLRFQVEPGLAADSLVQDVERRSVQRRPMSLQRLSDRHREQLSGAVGPSYSLLWFEGFSAKFRFARLLFRSARLRLTMPEAYEVHRSIIEWGAKTSADKVPDQALGASSASLKLMRFAMRSWPRVQFFNRYLAGTWPPRLEMDFVPALACAAHYVMLADRAPVSIDDFVDAGRAMQRLWLTATRLGLVMQPALTPLIFARYAREGRHFSAEPGVREGAEAVARRLDQLLAPRAAASNAVFMGRLGFGQPARSRSVRLSLGELIIRPGSQAAWTSPLSAERVREI